MKKAFLAILAAVTVSGVAHAGEGNWDPNRIEGTAVPLTARPALPDTGSRQVPDFNGMPGRVVASIPNQSTGSQRYQSSKGTTVDLSPANRALAGSR